MIVQESASSYSEQLLDEIIAEFLRAESAGTAGDCQQWLDRYPACAVGLREFFDDRQRFDRLVTPVRFDCPAPSSGDESTGIFEYPRPDGSAETVDLAPEPPQFAMPRYRPTRFHARGGMGEVWLAHDEHIGRQVALKKLRAGRKEQQARFLVEAQITGQLEHPSVVPLHDLGTDDAGQSFYVMKFIEGRRLHDVIADFHENKKRVDWAGDVEFVRLLQTFVNVCYAIAYAHSKGVMHRDIKPDNVMLGPFGETLILDWGLAKVVGQPEPRRDPSVKVSTGDSSTTRDGAIVGTLAYMSPEAACGHTEEVDQLSDVYLLGGTLYEIITDTPPRRGSSQYDLLELARRRCPPSPRKLDPRVPRALEAICLKAMAFDKHDRYQTAIALAEDVQRYLAGEPTTAYPEPIGDRILRWMRRHRRVIGQGLFLSGLLVLAWFALHSNRQARILAEREDARGRLSDFYRLADEAQFYAANIDPVSERVPYYDPRRAAAVGEAALKTVATWRDKADSFPLPESRDQFQRAQYNLLLVMAQANLRPDADDARARAALALLDQAKALEQPSRGYHRLRSQYLKLLGQRTDAQRETDLADRADAPTSAQDCFLQGELLRLEDVGSSAELIREETQPRRDYLAKAIEAYREAIRLDPRHYWARFQLGRCLLALGHGPEAIEALSGCIAIRPDAPWAYATRGLASGLSARMDEALGDLDYAVKLDPDFQPARLNRGIVHWLRKDLSAAKADFDAVLAVRPEIRIVEAGLYRGQLLLRQERIHDALADLSLVIDSRPDFSPAYWLRAQVRFRLGNYDDGQADLAKFVSLATRRSGDDALDHRLAIGKALRRMALELDGDAKTQALVRAERELHAAIASGTPTAQHYLELGAVQKQLARLSEAIASYSKGIAIAAEDVPLRNRRGSAYVEAGKIEEARADYAEAVRLDPANAESHAGLGYVTALAGDSFGAQVEALAATLSGSNNSLILHNVACIHGRLSELQQEDKIAHENLALAAIRRAVELSRQNPAVLDEVALIRQERAFPASLRARPEFQQLLSEQMTR